MASHDEVFAVKQILEAATDPVIFDLGSYLGEDAAWMFGTVHERNPKGLLVEADSRNYQSVKRVADQFKVPSLWGAISDHEGECDFWTCYTGDGRGSGSIRQPVGHLIKNPEYDFRKDVKIPCWSLDYLFHLQGFDHIDMLWTDIQGAERDMIKGGQDALAKTKYLFLEAETVRYQGHMLYDGQLDRDELLNALPGWIVVCTFDYNLLLRNESA